MTDRTQIVTLLRELVARQAMGYTERFEADAEAFYRETGFMAPGKSLPLEMPDHGERRESSWREWNARRSSAWTQAMDAAAEMLERQAKSLDTWAARAEKAEKALGEQCDGSGLLPDMDYVDHVAIPSGRPCPGCKHCAEAEIAHLKAELADAQKDEA